MLTCTIASLLRDQGGFKDANTYKGQILGSGALQIQDNDKVVSRADAKQQDCVVVKHYDLKSNSL